MERKRLERAFGTSVVEGEQGKLYMRVVEKRKPVVKGAPSWDEIAAMHESGSGSRKERDERKETRDVGGGRSGRWRCASGGHETLRRRKWRREAWKKRTRDSGGRDETRLVG